MLYSAPSSPRSQTLPGTSQMFRSPASSASTFDRGPSRGSAEASSSAFLWRGGARVPCRCSSGKTTKRSLGKVRDELLDLPGEIRDRRADRVGSRLGERDGKRTGHDAPVF